MTHSRSPQCRAFSRAVMDEKLLSPLFPICCGGGGVVGTNDWCISDVNIASEVIKCLDVIAIIMLLLQQMFFF